MSARGRLVVALASTGVIFYIAVGSVLGRVMGDTTYGQLTVFNEVIRMVLDSYVEPVNLDRTMAGAYRGLAEALDGDSAYLDAEQFKAYQEPSHRPLADVGLVLTRRYSFIMVVGTRPDSPARKAGIRTGDLLKTIEGQHTRPIPAEVGERMLQGAPGSSVHLQIMRPGTDLLDLDLVRERLTGTPPKGEMIGDGLARLEIPEFSDLTARQVRDELDGLRASGAHGLVLDLRGTCYGPLDQGVEVARLFVKTGLVAKVSGRRVADKTFEAEPRDVAWNLPVVVLVDRGTAGAGEILAAALEDSAAAHLVGEQTFGEAGVQQAFPLPEGGLVLTVAKYLTPKGKPIHGAGLEPTDEVRAKTAEEEGVPDPYLEKAREILAAGEAKKAA